MRKTLLFFVNFLIINSAVICFAAGGPPQVSSRIEQLGMRLYKDRNLSLNSAISCQSCHHPFAGFADRTNLMHPEVNIVSTGADGSTGDRNAPTAAYAGYSPVMHVEAGEYVGGLFWDGRATGKILGDPLAEQAQGPPLNPVEMALTSKEEAIEIIRQSNYARLWLIVFGADSLDNVDAAWDNFGRALAAYQRSADVTQFSSKFDMVLKGDAEFTAKEYRGYQTFRTNCASCHAIDNQEQFGAPAPLFTNFQYANVGIPSNSSLMLDSLDLGLGGFLDESDQNGKFKIPTLRNVGVTAPYSHNGSFATLAEMVNFLNDSAAYSPEVGYNLDERVGAIGLNQEEVDNLIAFLLTLTDGYE